MKKYFKLLRIKHYIKNGLIFIPIFFSGNLFSSEKLFSCLWGFLSFCLVSSSIYVFNDIMDIEADRRHPVKKERPIASGAISIRNAVICEVSCFIGAMIAMITSRGGFTSFGCILVYCVLNIAYSLYLKKRALWDVIILVSGFFIRILYGSVLSGVVISGWLYLTVIAASFYMAFGKRRNELSETGEKTRNVFKFYTYDFFDKNMYIYMGMANIFYSLWAMDNGNKMLATVPFVFFIFMRYSYDIECRESRGDPIEVILSDRIILLSALVCLIYMWFLLYKI